MRAVLQHLIAGAKGKKWINLLPTILQKYSFTNVTYGTAQSIHGSEEIPLCESKPEIMSPSPKYAQNWSWVWTKLTKSEKALRVT